MRTKLRGLFTLLLALVVQISFAQQKEVSGTVKDDDGLPLPGVNITVTGTDQGTQTDFDGHYSIKVEQGATLKFSFIGYADQTKKIGMQNTVDVVMKEGESLGEVMISTGYQTQTKRRSTKSVTTITAEDIQDRPNASAISALQGKVPGLNIGSNSGQPGTSGTVILRGVGTINGDVEPLFVIDGVASSKSNFTNLNPNDIKDVSVLKGPNATSIYGNRGSNGVVVVTTKTGSFNQKMEFKYSSQYGFSELMPLNLEIMNSKEKLTFQRDNNLGGMGQGLSDAQIDAMARTNNTYWGDYFFRKAQTNRQDLSITSGSENTSNATSISYLDQDGIFIASGLQRFGFRNKFTGKTDDDKFHYTTNINISYSKSDFDNRAGDRNIFFNPFMNSMQGSPLLSPYDPDGSVTTDGGLPFHDNAALTKKNAPYILLNSAAHNTIREEQLNIIGSLHADWNFANHFVAGVDVSANLTQFRNTSITDPLSLLGPFQVDSRADFGGIDTEQSRRDARFTTRTNLGYSNQFGAENKHSLDVNLYTEYNKSHYNNLGYSTRGLDPKLVGSADAFQYQVKQDLGDGLDYIYVPSLSLFLDKISTGLFSYFGTVDYDFDNRLGFSGSIRRDASVRFTDDNKWGTFWSVSGRWNIDSESWMENSAFNLLKLRAGYGTSGNQRITTAGPRRGYYGGLDLFQNLYSSGSAYNNTSGYYPSVIANPALKWETTKQINVGVDFGVWKNKLQGTLDVYRKKTEDIYNSKPISLVNATSSINANVGAMENKGVELYLKYNIYDDQDWNISVSANGSYNHNKILKLGGADENGLVRSDGPTSLKEGESINEYFSVRYAGVNPSNGHSLFYDKEGNLTEELNEADRVFDNKQIIPEIQGGFGANISYKGFSLSQNWVYYANVWRNNLDLADMEGAANYVDYNAAASLLRAWQKPGDITDIPRLNPSISTIDHINQSDRYIQDASYLRLRNITLGYTFGKDKLKRLPFTSVKLYIQAENLLTFTKYEGYDPESSYTGIESSRYPSAKTYTVGLNVNF